MQLRSHHGLLVLLLIAGTACAQTVDSAPSPIAGSTPGEGPPKSSPMPPPTLADVHYGEHPRQVLDFWKAPSDKPTPVVFHMHGGGWMKGDKSEIPAKINFKQYLDAGISVVLINYRYVWQAQEAGVKPPVEWPMHDGMRALQFVRSKAAEWNIDKERIAGSGGSAGACTVLWLALHDEMAQPTSDDPVARESTRFRCVGVDVPQTSLDPKQMKEWIPNSRYGGHAFGFPSAKDMKKNEDLFADFLARRDEVLPWIREYSPIEHATAGDPPICIACKEPPALGQPQKDPTHSANFGVKLQEKLKSLGVECELIYPGAPAVKHAAIPEFLIEKLKE